MEKLLGARLWRCVFVTVERVHFRSVEQSSVQRCEEDCAEPALPPPPPPRRVWHRLSAHALRGTIKRQLWCSIYWHSFGSRIAGTYIFRHDYILDNLTSIKMHCINLTQSKKKVKCSSLQFQKQTAIEGTQLVLKLHWCKVKVISKSLEFVSWMLLKMWH